MSIDTKAFPFVLFVGNTLKRLEALGKCDPKVKELLTTFNECHDRFYTDASVFWIGDHVGLIGLRGTLFISPIKATYCQRHKYIVQVLALHTAPFGPWPSHNDRSLPHVIGKASGDHHAEDGTVITTYPEEVVEAAIAEAIRADKVFQETPSSTWLPKGVDIESVIADKQRAKAEEINQEKLKVLAPWIALAPNGLNDFMQSQATKALVGFYPHMVWWRLTNEAKERVRKEAMAIIASAWKS